MNRIMVLVEGQTERAIVDQVFNPELSTKGIYLYPRVVGKPGHKGGNRFAAVVRELKALLRQDQRSYVTMLFDYYGLGDDWPDLAQAKGRRPEDIPGILEPAITARLASHFGAGFNQNRFIPYVQLHEVESLLFAGPGEMAKAFQRPELEDAFSEIVRQCGGCELINDGPETAPSKRIMKLFPQYKKGSSVNAHAHQIAKHIGLTRIRRQCPHFNEWLDKLEHLAD